MLEVILVELTINYYVQLQTPSDLKGLSNTETNVLHKVLHLHY